MSTQQNIETLEEIYAAFGRGDVAFIVDRLTDDVSWVIRMDPIVPWSGDFSGKARIPEFFKAIYDSVDVTAFAGKEWIAEGDNVVSVGEFGCRVRQTGKSSHTRWVFLWKFRGGKIYSYEQFHDPALTAAFA